MRWDPSSPFRTEPGGAGGQGAQARMARLEEIVGQRFVLAFEQVDEAGASAKPKCRLRAGLLTSASMTQHVPVELGRHAHSEIEGDERLAGTRHALPTITRLPFAGDTPPSPH